MSVTTAVIPAAGLGTRFLPATKAVPKELLPVVDRPVLQYAVAEAASAGVERVILVVSPEKEAPLLRHFARDEGLERLLHEQGKDEFADAVRAVAALAEVEAVIQEEPLGLGHAVHTARDAVGREPFAVLLPDEVILTDLLAQLVAVHDAGEASAIGLLRMSRDEVSAYGCPEAKPVEDPRGGGDDSTADVVEIRGIIEKPRPADAPSDLGSIGRYVFTPSIFDALARIEPGAGGEFQLTDAISLLTESEPVYGVVGSGERRFDVGKKSEFLRANVALALEREDVGPGFRAWLHEFLDRP